MKRHHYKPWERRGEFNLIINQSTGFSFTRTVTLACSTSHARVPISGVFNECARCSAFNDFREGQLSRLHNQSQLGNQPMLGAPVIALVGCFCSKFHMRLPLFRCNLSKALNCCEMRAAISIGASETVEKNSLFSHTHRHRQINNSAEQFILLFFVSEGGRVKIVTDHRRASRL